MVRSRVYWGGSPMGARVTGMKTSVDGFGGSINAEGGKATTTIGAGASDGEGKGDGRVSVGEAGGGVNSAGLWSGISRIGSSTSGCDSSKMSTSIPSSTVISSAAAGDTNATGSDSSPDSRTGRAGSASEGATESIVSSSSKASFKTSG